MQKVLDLEKPNTTVVSSGPRIVEENICVHLLLTIDSESDSRCGARNAKVPDC
jgi:hypothetical protein